MSTYDTDESGELNFNEFVLMMGKIILTQEVDPELRESFLVFNISEGFGIDAEELRTTMREFGYILTTEESQDLH